MLTTITSFKLLANTVSTGNTAESQNDVACVGLSVRIKTVYICGLLSAVRLCCTQNGSMWV